MQASLIKNATDVRLNLSLPHRTICTTEYYTLYIKEKYFLELVITALYALGKSYQCYRTYTSHHFSKKIKLCFSLHYVEKHCDRGGLFIRQFRKTLRPILIMFLINIPNKWYHLTTLLSLFVAYREYGYTTYKDHPLSSRIMVRLSISSCYEYFLY